MWFTDRRDFRSPNKLSDGAEKTIWGAEQEAWCTRTVKEGTATWKVLGSRTPLIDPDRARKHDNHRNSAWLQANAPENFLVGGGDRHWQYHSVHPAAGGQEFSVGPASDSHASETADADNAYHRFHRVKGGLLCVEVGAAAGKGALTFPLRGVDRGNGYEAKRTQPA